jgi:hypothetical protein
MPWPSKDYRLYLSRGRWEGRSVPGWVGRLPRAVFIGLFAGGGSLTLNAATVDHRDERLGISGAIAAGVLVAGAVRGYRQRRRRRRLPDES